MTASTTTTRNVHQRKLAVMHRCKDIVPDATHPAHKYKYNSIQQVSNRLREYAVEEGLDITEGFDPEHPGYLRFVLTNADDPKDEIVSWWPEVAGDRGFAYSTKYPLVRMFLVGDGEENDESEMAAASGARTSTGPSQTAQRAASNGHATPAALPASPGEIAPSSVATEAARLFDAYNGKEKWDIVSRFGWAKGRGVTPWLRGLTAESVVSVRDALSQLVEPEMAGVTSDAPAPSDDDIQF